MSFKILLLFGWSSIIFKTFWTFSYLFLNLLLSLAFSNHFLFSISMMSSRLISSSNNLIRCLRQFHIFKDRRFYMSFALSYFYGNHTSFVLRTESGSKLGHFIKALKYMYHKIKRYLVFSLSLNYAKVFILFAKFKLEYKFLLTLSIFFINLSE